MKQINTKIHFCEIEGAAIMIDWVNHNDGFNMSVLVDLTAVGENFEKCIVEHKTFFNDDQNLPLTQKEFESNYDYNRKEMFSFIKDYIYEAIKIFDKETGIDHKIIEQ